MIKRLVSERFWEKVERRAPDDCWPWRSAVLANGYGEFGMNKTMRSAHRVAWELTNGPIPHGMSICHRCDYKQCVNPAHLFAATPRENTQDMIAKGRRAYTGCRGSTNGRAKLTPHHVQTIRLLTSSSVLGTTAIARLFGVNRSTILLISKRVRWPDVPDLDLPLSAQ